MTEVFNKFLDELANELNIGGAGINKLDLKGKNLIISMQNGRQIPLRDLPLPSETLLYVATRFLNPKKVGALFGQEVSSLPKNFPGYRSTPPLLRGDSGTLSILAILVLVLVVVGGVTFIFNRNNGVGGVIPPEKNTETTQARVPLF